MYSIFPEPCQLPNTDFFALAGPDLANRPGQGGIGPENKLGLPVREDTVATINAGQRHTRTRTVTGKKKRKQVDGAEPTRPLDFHCRVTSLDYNFSGAERRGPNPYPEVVDRSDTGPVYL